LAVVIGDRSIHNGSLGASQGVLNNVHVAEGGLIHLKQRGGLPYGKRVVLSPVKGSVVADGKIPSGRNPRVGHDLANPNGSIGGELKDIERIAAVIKAVHPSLQGRGNGGNGGGGGGGGDGGDGGDGGGEGGGKEGGKKGEPPPPGLSGSPRSDSDQSEADNYKWLLDVLIAPYFYEAYRPVTKGDVFFVRWKGLSAKFIVRETVVSSNTDINCICEPNSRGDSVSSDSAAAAAAGVEGDGDGDDGAGEGGEDGKGEGGNGNGLNGLAADEVSQSCLVAPKTVVEFSPDGPFDENTSNDCRHCCQYRDTQVSSEGCSDVELLHPGGFNNRVSVGSGGTRGTNGTNGTTGDALRQAEQGDMRGAPPALRLPLSAGGPGNEGKETGTRGETNRETQDVTLGDSLISLGISDPENHYPSGRPESAERSIESAGLTGAGTAQGIQFPVPASNSNQAHSRAYDQITARLGGGGGYENEGSFDVNKTFCQGLVAGTRVLPLFLAVGCWGEPSNEDCLELLLRQDGVDVNVLNTRGESALLNAACQGKDRCVELLLAVKDIDVNVPEKEGCTALYMAAWQGKDRCVELLLGMGKDICDVNARNLSGQHSLWIAAHKGNTRCVELLLSIPEMRVNEGAFNGDTPLFTAAFNGRERAVGLLLKSDRVKVNETNQKGETPLHAAGNQGHHRCVELLLDAPGIKVNESDLASMSPLISCCAHVSQAVEHINKVGLYKIELKNMVTYYIITTYLDRQRAR
jgi:ankyrin repeat protein